MGEKIRAFTVASVARSACMDFSQSVPDLFVTLPLFFFALFFCLLAFPVLHPPHRIAHRPHRTQNAK